MSKTSWQVKKKYNDRVYKRLVAELPRDLVDEFRDKCKEAGVSQTSVIREAVEEFIKAGN